MFNFFFFVLNNCFIFHMFNLFIFVIYKSLWYILIYFKINYIYRTITNILFFQYLLIYLIIHILYLHLYLWIYLYLIYYIYYLYTNRWHLLCATSEFQPAASHRIFLDTSLSSLYPHCYSIMGVLLDQQGGNKWQSSSWWVHENTYRIALGEHIKYR